ncbi:MAG: hypothetical protein KAR47_13510, partial [Planctomycetes bacterium]|nr:hypothetical protein [Planctomycetota bacterium]
RAAHIPSPVQGSYMAGQCVSVRSKGGSAFAQQTDGRMHIGAHHRFGFPWQAFILARQAYASYNFPRIRQPVLSGLRANAK